MNSVRVKQDYRPLFLALQADAKTYPGGINALATALNCNPTTLANQLNPDHDTNPPCFGKILEIYNLTQGKRTIYALCQLVGMLPVPAQVETPGDSLPTLLTTCSRMSELIKVGTEAASDLRLDAAERKELSKLLIDIIPIAAAALRAMEG